MSGIVIHPEKIPDPARAVEICPFGAIQLNASGKLEISAACRLCKACVRNGPPGGFEFVEDKPEQTVDKTAWNGIAVYIDQTKGRIHPVSLELIGKARELADKTSQPVFALLIGHGLDDTAKELRHYGVDKIFQYDAPELSGFRNEPFAAAFEDFIRKDKPSTVLVGGTTVGRSLAPRVAARFATGLTADCTSLDVQPNTDLDQIRPAFGGNIMAHIRTPNQRPQFATVRYKIFSAPERRKEASGEIIVRTLPAEKLASPVEILASDPKPPVKLIEDANVVVVAGLGIGCKENLVPLQRLADKLGGMLGASRPVVEAGWVEPRCQIGLSGRTVKPQLLIACGVSGSIQFSAGITGAERIIAINNDPDAPIFKVAHVAVVGDVTEIIPALLREIGA